MFKYSLDIKSSATVVTLLLLQTHSSNSSKVMSLSTIFVSSTIRLVFGMSAQRAVIREIVKLLLL